MLAESPASVVIQGETGTGKELVAEAIHHLSPRADRAYRVVDCASAPGELIESELFGHVRGAFTGAVSDRPGAFEEADQGTIFIDEIGELPLELQPRLLRVLEKQELKRVGADAVKKLDVRILSATNRNLEDEVRAGRFRQDLFYRLSVVRLELPPLRDRPEDIDILAERFLEEIADPTGAPIQLGDDVRARLRTYAWPGNVRELRNVIDRGAALSDVQFRLPENFGRGIDREEAETEPALRSTSDGSTSEGSVPARPTGELTRPLWNGRTYKEAKEAVMADFECGYVQALLEQHQGNVSAAARSAQIHRNILHRMIARYRIKR